MLSKFLQWNINVFLNVLRLKTRNSNLWLFGAWGGDKYSDNSKYLFEYVINNFLDIEAIWITKNEEIEKSLKSRGIKCFLSHTLEARKARLEAKYYFFTNGARDFGCYDLGQGATKIALWHGMPLKKIGYAANVTDKKKGIVKRMKYYYLKIYNPSQRDITIATSEFTRELMIQSFEVKPETVFITGQPRNDILFNSEVQKKVKSLLGHKDNEKFVLYMPTWREFGTRDTFLDEIISDIQDDVEFNSSLIEKNIKLYIKPHPRIMIKSKSKENIVIVDGHDMDAQELISASDELITDYSSVFIDYALLERPIHFFVPDLEEYKQSSTGLFVSFDQFSEYTFSDQQILKKVIIGGQKFFRYGKMNCKRINTLFNNPELIKGQYSRNVIETLKREKIINLQR